VHEERFPPPRLSARCRFSQGTFAGMRGNGRDAPIPAVRGAAVEPPSSTSYEPLPEPNTSCSRCDGWRESRHEVVR
jgi:hypothetical protein